jgi:hypothetical protein
MCLGLRAVWGCDRYGSYGDGGHRVAVASRLAVGAGSLVVITVVTAAGKKFEKISRTLVDKGFWAP